MTGFKVSLLHRVDQLKSEACSSFCGELFLREILGSVVPKCLGKSNMLEAPSTFFSWSKVLEGGSKCKKCDHRSHF